VPKFSGLSCPRAPNAGAVSSFGSAVSRFSRQRVPRFGGSSH
jgi:hypothetical protein